MQVTCGNPARNSEWRYFLRSGILLDFYYAQLLEVESTIERNDLVIVNVFKPKDWSIGISLPGRKELVECMRKAYDHDYARVLYDAILREDISRTVSIL